MKTEMWMGWGVGLVAWWGLGAGEGKAETVLIGWEAEWAYHDGGEDLGEAWRGVDFDDGGWARGQAVLGYGAEGRVGGWPSPGLRTPVREHLTTYYFRKAFDYTGTGEGEELVLSQIVDDGVVYYLNGEEIGRMGMAREGAVKFGDLATVTTNPQREDAVLRVDATRLREGRNVLAATVHNRSETSSDIAFGARLEVVEKTEEPLAFYLSWQRDPTTTMTVQWHTMGRAERAAIEVAGPDGAGWVRQEGTAGLMPFSERMVNTVELTGLEAGVEYRFRILGEGPGRHSEVMKFRTMPARADEPIRIAVGGDVRHRKAWMEQTNREAVRMDPHFVVWGGDLAYGDGKPENLSRWEEFFEAMKGLVTAEGRVIPVVMGIGNHEVRGGYYWGEGRGREGYEDTDAFREEIAPYFYGLFAFPGHPGRGVLDFGDYLSLVVLDTDHSTPVEGAQTAWLAEVLAARERVPHLIPVYHVPAYPSVRNFEGGTARAVRTHWVPLFEKHGVRLAFEHHDHAYKRTVPIREGKPEAGGVVYVGDGAWGVGERAVHDVEATWYLARAESMRHFILLTLHEGHRDLKVISREGRLMDHFVQPGRVH